VIFLPRAQVVILEGRRTQRADRLRMTRCERLPLGERLCDQVSASRSPTITLERARAGNSLSSLIISAHATLPNILVGT
jgi:hypothetical protein